MPRPIRLSGLALLALAGAMVASAASANSPPPEGAVGAWLAAKAKARADAARSAAEEVAASAAATGGARSVDAASASAFGDAYDLYAAGYDDDDLWDEEDHPDVRVWGEERQKKERPIQKLARCCCSTRRSLSSPSLSPPSLNIPVPGRRRVRRPARLRPPGRRLWR